MSGKRIWFEEEPDFTLDEEEGASYAPPIGALYPLPTPLASVLLAWAIGRSPEPFPEDAEDLDLISRKVLVVEDDRSSRTVLNRLLTAEGWEVAEAGTVAEGLEGLDPPPFCLILDLILPDGDGIELLRYIRAAGLSTRVVIATGTLDEALLENVAGLGPDSLHHKPLNYQAICRDCVG